MNNPEQTTMTAPPANETKMVAGKKIKVKVLRDCKLADGTILTPERNPEAEIPEADFNILSKPVDGYYNFAGERYEADGDVKKQAITRVKKI